ncbi:MAG: sugar phosphate nucleotidyltransferase, partial [Chloroflexota bacterium]
VVDGRAVYGFSRQIEKPPLEQAEGLIAAGHCLWNTGYIVWTAEKILSLYAQHAPETFALLQRIVRAIDEPNARERVAELYHTIPKMSIDKGIFEHMGGHDMVVMPAELGWSDIGAWDVLRDELKDAALGHAVHGKYIPLNSNNNLIYAPEGKHVITIGMDNLIVVDTGDALLICPADRAQEVKAVVQRLEREQPDLL